MPIPKNSSPLEIIEDIATSPLEHRLKRIPGDLIWGAETGGSFFIEKDDQKWNISNYSRDIYPRELGFLSYEPWLFLIKNKTLRLTTTGILIFTKIVQAHRYCRALNPIERALALKKFGVVELTEENPIVEVYNCEGCRAIITLIDDLCIESDSILSRQIEEGKNIPEPEQQPSDSEAVASVTKEPSGEETVSVDEAAVTQQTSDLPPEDKDSDSEKLQGKNHTQKPTRSRSKKRSAGPEPTTPNKFIRLSVEENQRIWRVAKSSGTNPHDFMRSAILKEVETRS